MQWFTTARNAGLILLCLIAFGCTSQPKRSIAPNERIINGGRDLTVVVPQAELEADINVANGGAAFGLIGALIDTSVNQSRASGAQDSVKSVRDAMTGYSFDTRALATAKSAFDQIRWIGMGKVSFVKELSDDQITRTLDAASTQQVILTSFRYALKPDFSALSTAWTVSILPQAAPAGKKPADRLKTENFIYQQRFECIVPLANPSKDKLENANIWASNQALLARSAVESCLSYYAPLIQRTIDMSAEQHEGLKKGAKYSDNYVTGQTIDKLPRGSLVLGPSDAWVLVLNPQMLAR